MGFESNRFEGDVDEELICPICSQVLEDPIQAPCEHAFCSSCINEWLSRQTTCPVDRQHIVPPHLKPAPRIMRNLLARLSIHCEFMSNGCPAVVKLEMLASHVRDCEFNPRAPVVCDRGCGLVITKDTVDTHNCVHSLRDLVAEQQAAIQELRVDQANLKVQLTEQKREIQILKEYIRNIQSVNPGSPGTSSNNSGPLVLSPLNNSTSANRSIGNISSSNASDQQLDEIRQWVMTMRVAKVTRWGGMISTPDAVLQAVIKRGLIESGCPSAIVNDLMENAHERRWPNGLSSLETRQMNRRLYENYIARRIPGRQAVLVLATENSHMPPDLILDPGMVMIFAHGVE